MTTYVLRILVCIIVGAILAFSGLSYIDAPSLTTQMMSPIAIGCGLLIIMYGFSPSTAKEIIKAIVKIVSLPFKTLFR